MRYGARFVTLMLSATRAILMAALLLHRPNGATATTTGASLAPAPLPPDPGTVMANVPIPDAVARGALYPSGEPAFYTANFNRSSTGWVVHLSGGGWNFLNNSTATATATKDGAAATAIPAATLGACYGKCDGILSNDPHSNPDFYAFNKIFVPIGDRTSFTADRWQGQPLYRGKRILDGAVHDLLTRQGMDKATDIILTGGSSGGLATYLNCDRVSRMVAPSAARFACLADAGFFMDHNNTQGVMSTVSLDFRESFYAWNSSAGTNQACIAHYGPRGEPWRCIFAEYVVPFIQSRLFVMQNLYDSWQLKNILGVTCTDYGQNLSRCDAREMGQIQAYGADMRARLARYIGLAGPVTGVYAPSCIAHVQSVENEHPEALWHWEGRWGIDGQTAGFKDAAVRYPRETFGDWYFGRQPPSDTIVEQRCDWGPMCNKLCPMYT